MAKTILRLASGTDSPSGMFQRLTKKLTSTITSIWKSCTTQWNTILLRTVLSDSLWNPSVLRTIPTMWFRIRTRWHRNPFCLWLLVSRTLFRHVPSIAKSTLPLIWFQHQDVRLNSLLERCSSPMSKYYCLWITRVRAISTEVLLTCTARQFFTSLQCHLEGKPGIALGFSVGYLFEHG